MIFSILAAAFCAAAALAAYPYLPEGAGPWAVGAAYLAGIATNFWHSQDEIAHQWRVERTFTPRMSADQRDTHYAGWQRAVERSKGWITDGA